MNKIKKIFSLVIAFALVLGTLASALPAFAETVDGEENILPKDVMGTEYEKAVKRLVAFGLIEGYPDGTYKPENEINRAQFAKLLVYALGLEKAAMAIQGEPTGFSDVKEDYWAGGYINIAVDQGLIKGYPDGRFGPTEKVTYAHTLTMLVRALGYNDEILPGNWPGNYIAKASDIGIIKGVKLSEGSDQGSKRGVVAQLINNTLDSKVVEVVGYGTEAGPKYSETEESLLESKLKISKYQDTRVIADGILEEDLGKDRVKVRFLQDNESKIFESKIDVRPFLGEETSIYLTDEDELLYLERENDDVAKFDYIEDVNRKKITLANFDEDYKFEDDADVYVFDSNSNEFKLYSGKDVKESDLLGKMGKFVIRDSKIIYAEVLDGESVIVLKNQNGLIEGIKGTDDKFELDLRDNQNYDYSLVYNTKGQVMDLRDIEEGNIIYVQKQDYSRDEIGFVTVVKGNKEECLVEEIKKDELKLCGDTVHLAKAGDDYTAYYQVDKYEGIKAWNGSTWKEDMKSVDEKEAVVYRDGAGRLVFLDVKDAVSEYKFGVVTRTYSDGERVKIFTTIDKKQGEDKIFTAENPSDLDIGQKLLGSAVKFRVNSKGEIAEGEFMAMPYGSAVKMPKDEDFGRDTIKANNGKAYSISLEDIKIINAPKLQDKAPVDIKSDYGDLQGERYGGNKEVDTSKFEVKTWEDFKKIEYDRDVEFYVFTKDNVKSEVEALVFIGEGPSDEVAVYVLDKWRRGSEDIVKYVSYPENKVETRILDEVYGQKDELKEKAYIGEEKATGEIKLYYSLSSGEEDYFDHRILRNAKINKISGDFIEVMVEGKEGMENIYIKDALIYKEDRSKSSSILRNENIVDIIKEGDIGKIIIVK